MTARRKLGSLTALALIIVFTASCAGQGTAGHAKAAGNSGESSSAAESHSSVPKKDLLAPPVPKALNAKPFLSKDEICKIVNQEQAKQLGLTKPHVGKRTADSLSISCDYDSGQPSGNSVGAGFLVANKRGLSDIYAKKSHKNTWEPFKVQGYPVVTIDKDADARSCIMYLGVTDRLAIQLSYFGKDSVSAEEACKHDKKLAGMVISNLKLQE